MSEGKDKKGLTLEQAKEEILRLIQADGKINAELEAQPWNGVAGLPPVWVPEPVRARFRQARDRALYGWGYDVELLIERIDSYAEEGLPPFHEHPNGQPLDPEAYNEVVGFLAHLLWCVSLGAENGLKELGGERAVLGYQMDQGRRKQRRDALRRAMEDAILTFQHRRGRFPSYKELLERLDREPCQPLCDFATTLHPSSPVESLLSVAAARRFAPHHL